MNVAIIPARGGSKRIPRKNIRPFLGKPIIGYSIEAAKNSGLFDAVVVSTDDREIAEVAEGFGASVPFFREKSLADDHATIFDVLSASYHQLKGEGQDIEKLCCIYATAPLINVQALKKGEALLGATENAAVAISVAEFPYPIQRALGTNSAGLLEMIDKSHLNTRSQDLPEAYMDAAQFIWCDSALFEKQASSLFDFGVLPVVIPTSEVQDIDTLDDWDRAEVIYRYIQERKKGV